MPGLVVMRILALTFLLLLFHLCIFSQPGKNDDSAYGEMELHYNLKELHLKRKVERDPALLVQALTAGKSSEKEKFDALFAWVAGNIRYNYRTYYSPNGTAMPDIKKVLRYKSGICFDYAVLMDDLCALAGIRNMTVFGYAKDEIFDVNDTLYRDNHVWNAVMLDGSWYVYDVTWASGSPDYKYTAFSRLILRWIGKFKLREKEYRVKTGIRDRGLHCREDTTQLIFKYQTYRFPGLLRILYAIPLHVKARLNMKIDTDYYLGDSTIRLQHREGRSCGACTANSEMDSTQKLRYLESQSYYCNKKNHFVAFFCEANLADLSQSRALAEADSSGKIAWIDSTLHHLDAVQKHLVAARSLVSEEDRLQKGKNSKKFVLLKEENKSHKKTLVDEKNRAYHESANMLRLRRVCISTIKKYYRQREKIYDYTNAIRSAKSKGEQKMQEAVISKLDKLEKRIAGISQMIDSQKSELESIIPSVIRSVSVRSQGYDSICQPFRKSIWYRSHLLDNYKREIVECRKTINGLEKKYSREAEDNVFIPLHKVIDLETEIFLLIDDRNRLYVESILMRKEQTASGAMQVSVYNNYILGAIEEKNTDICWLLQQDPYLVDMVLLFSKLRRKEAFLEYLIRVENTVEAKRFSYINRELNRRKSKCNRILNRNTLVTKVDKQNLKIYKREYLKKLREERRRYLKTQS